MTLNVTKRDGSTEPLNIEKIHQVVIWATEGLGGVSASEVEIRSQIQFYDGITTKDIHETLIKAAADLISEDAPNYQYVAGRLVNYALRKEVYGGYAPKPLYETVSLNVFAGFYDPLLLSMYTRDEWGQVERFVDHTRDMSLAYAATEQLRGKYLVQNRSTGKIMETPQLAYALIAATLFQNYPANTRLHWVRAYYDAISNHEISLPTPVMAGVRTPQRQFSSCVLIETDDSLDSINATTSAIVKYVSQKAGIGIGGGRIRALKSPIRTGDATHTGVIPFYKLFQSAVGSCSQGGVRKGSATVYFPWFHLDVEALMVLKNNKGTEETRARFMDYGVQFNRLFYARLVAGQDVTLFSPHDVKELYEAFFEDQDRFKELYEAAEANPTLRKKKISALELFTAFVQERKDTGRIYLQNVDHSNTHSSFVEREAPVRMSNLCTEITLPTVPLTDLHDENGRIALCILSAINWGKIATPAAFERVCTLAVRGLDALIDIQTYPVRAAEVATKEFRPIGVGIINLAYWLAKRGYRYSDDTSLAELDAFAEAWSFYLIRASVDLAMEQGPCTAYQKTKYAAGIMPIDTRKREVDELVPHRERLDWDGLRADAKTYGIRNATLMALMPAETSAQVANATNGIEPPRAYVSVKQSKDGVLKQVVPEYETLRDSYELLWDQKSPVGYLNICAVLQKYVDQAISVNTSYNPSHYPDDIIPMSELMGHVLHAYRMGAKTLYYNNSNDQQGEVDVDKTIRAAPQADEAEEHCESCTI